MCVMITRMPKNTHFETILQFYKVVATPTLLYDLEYWTLAIVRKRELEQQRLNSKEGLEDTLYYTE